MDKNFIKVDDLFRQRLAGGEEKERGGAWLNMRDLLDREMPQEKRIGILYWRRLFGVVAALSLVGTVSVGSYELSSAFKSRNIVDVSVPPIPTANNEAGDAYVLSATEKVKADEAQAAARTNSRIAANITDTKERHAVASQTIQQSNSVAGGAAGVVEKTASTAVAGKAQLNNTNRNEFSAKSTTLNSNSSSLNSINSTNTNEANGRKEIAIRNHRSIKNNRHITATAAAQNNATAGKEAIAGTQHSTTANNATASTAVSKTGRDHAAAINNGIASKEKAANTATGNNAAAPININGVNTDIKNNKPVLSSSSSSATTLASNVAAGNKAPINTTNTEVTTHKTQAAATQKETAVSNQPVSSGVSSTASAAARNNVAATDANNDTKEHVAPATPATMPATGVVLKNANTENPNGQNKKVITKLLVHQRNIKVAENEYALKEDTISMEKINMDMGLKQPADNSNTTPADLSATVKAKRGAKRLFGSRNHNNAVANTATANIGASGAAAPATTGGKAGRNSQSNSGNVAAGGADNEYAANGSASGTTEGTMMAKPGSVADASISPNGSSSETSVIKPKATTKQGSGASLIQRLSLAFNDVKENASRTRFTPGLTAGINSNFFGPATFKGFQFGLTGDIIFNENWNVLTELKYFHRLNNNTSIEDDYYTYTQVGSEYRKDLQLNSYSFSALHSLEVPVTIRYHKGNFNFYAGGNFLYSFSINTGASTMPAVNVAPEFVSAPGTDNAPKLSEADFRSRFGLGYLFGFSYDVAPNLSLDLRNVQTVWDNAATTGAKSISGQLYKTPSLQLSIMYRLGGNRNKD
jgi:hypothetical protein